MASEIVGYVANVGMSMLFGLGYYLVKNKKPVQTNKSKEIEKDLSLLISLNNLQDVNNCLKEKKFESDQYEFLNLMLQKGFKPNIESYNLLLGNAFFLRKTVTANKLKQELLSFLDIQHEIKPDSLSLSMMIKGLGMEYATVLHPQTKNYEEYVDLCEGSNYNIELSKDKKLRFDLELRCLVTKFTEKGIDLDMNCHNNLIVSLVETNRIEDAWKHFKFLNDSNSKYKPDVYTYLNILKGIKRLSNQSLKKIFIGKVKNFFNDCDYLKEKSNYSTIFLSLFDLIVKYSIFSSTSEENMKEVENDLYLNDSKFENDEDLEHAYCILINGYAKLNELNGAMRCFENLKKRCKKLSSYSYSSILNACSRTKNTELAEILFEEMLQNKIKPNQYVYATLINGYKKVNNFQAAIRLYLKLRENSMDSELEDDLKLSTVIFNSILDCCVGCGEFDQMQLIFNYLADLGQSRNFINDICSVSSVLTSKTKIKANIQPDLISYSILIKGYAKANNLKKVLEVYDYLKESFEVDEVLFNTLLDCFVVNENKEAFEKIYKEMQDQQIKPSVVTYGIIMKLHCNRKDLSKATDTFYEMVSNGITPSIIIYQLLIKLNSRLNRFEECFNLYKKLSNSTSSVKPDCMLTDFMVDLYCKNFMIDEATSICEQALDGFTKELEVQINLQRKNQSSVEMINENISNSEFYLGLSNTYQVEVKESEDKRFFNFNFDNNTTSSMLDLGTIEFFVWGVIEEKDLIYIDKKLIIERLATKINTLYNLIYPFSLGCDTEGNAKSILDVSCYDDTKSLSTVLTNINNKGNMSYKLVDMIFKLKKDTFCFLKNSAYDTNKNFMKLKTNHYQNNLNYQKRLVNSSRQYQEKKCLYEKKKEEKEFFNAEEDVLDFNDNSSVTTFRSNFKLKPSANFYQKKQNEEIVIDAKHLDDDEIDFDEEVVPVETLKINKNENKNEREIQINSFTMNEKKQPQTTKNKNNFKSFNNDYDNNYNSYNNYKSSNEISNSNYNKQVSYKKKNYEGYEKSNNYNCYNNYNNGLNQNNYSSNKNFNQTKSSNNLNGTNNFNENYNTNYNSYSNTNTNSNKKTIYSKGSQSIYG